MSYIDWDDIVKKITPSGKRYTWHLDWLYSQIKGIKDIDTTTKVLTDELDVKSDHNIAVNMIEKRLNDLYDPHHREIYTVQTNYDAANSDGFTVKVPTYLQYGDIEDRMTDTINYYLMAGVTYSYSYFAASFTHTAKTYIDAMAGTPDDSEMWSIINFYNKIRGHGMWAGMEHIKLFSRVSLADAKIGLVGATLGEAGAGAIAFDRWGCASDGARYFTTAYNPFTAGIDIQNSATLYYISQKNGNTMSEGGSYDGTPDYNTFGISNNASDETIGIQGLVADILNAGVNLAGAFLQVAVAGKSRIRRNTEYIGAEITMTGAVAANQAEFLCAESQAGTPGKHSTNKLGTWIRYKGALSPAQQIILNNAVVEYNNLNSR